MPAGIRTYASQAVSVVDTTPPAITCASNQVVEYGVAWDFAVPTARMLPMGRT